MSNIIRHAGVIESIEDGHVKVRIVQTTACAACQVAAHCNAAESKEKTIDVYQPQAGLRVGDAVVLTAAGQVAARALWLGYGLPLLLLLAVLVAVLAVTGREAVAALSGIAALIPYYVGLYFVRNRLQEKLSFSIEA